MPGYEQVGLIGFPFDQDDQRISLVDRLAYVPHDLLPLAVAQVDEILSAGRTPLIVLREGGETGMTTLVVDLAGGWVQEFEQWVLLPRWRNSCRLFNPCWQADKRSDLVMRRDAARMALMRPVDAVLDALFVLRRRLRARS